MNKKQFKELPDEEKLKIIYELLDMVNDYTLKCFIAGWRRVPSTISLWDRQAVDKMRLEYGDEAVRDGFIAARENGVEKINYVRNVAKSIHEKKTIQKNQEKHQEIKKEEKRMTYNFADDPDWQKLKNKISLNTKASDGNL